MSFILPCDIKYNPHGIRSRDVEQLRRQHGDNSFTRRPRKTFLRQYLSAFGDPIIKILLAALALNILIAIKNANIYARNSNRSVFGYICVNAVRIRK